MIETHRLRSRYGRPLEFGVFVIPNADELETVRSPRAALEALGEAIEIFATEVAPALRS